MVEYRGIKCHTVFKKYSNGNTRIELIDPHTFIPVVTATTSIDSLYTNEVAINNHGEHKGLLDILIKESVVSEPHRYINAQYHNVPICKLIKKHS